MQSRIFVSYSYSDAAIAETIVKALTAKGLSPWIDRQENQPGQSFVAGMNAGLSEASYLLALFSKNSLQSTWASREWMSALAGKIPVLPVLLEGGEVPLLLKDIVYFDLRSDISAGIAKITKFFDMELRPLHSNTSRAVTESPLKNADRRQLRLLATKCLDDVDLSAFCFDAEIEMKSLSGTSVLQRVLSLLHEVNNEGLAIQFSNWLVMEKKRCIENHVNELRRANTWEWQRLS